MFFYIRSFKTQRFKISRMKGHHKNHIKIHRVFSLGIGLRVIYPFYCIVLFNCSQQQRETLRHRNYYDGFKDITKMILSLNRMETDRWLCLEPHHLSWGTETNSRTDIRSLRLRKFLQWPFTPFEPLRNELYSSLGFSSSPFFLWSLPKEL